MENPLYWTRVEHFSLSPCLCRYLLSTWTCILMCSCIHYFCKISCSYFHLRFSQIHLQKGSAIMHPVCSILRERDDGTTRWLSGITTTSTMRYDLASASSLWYSNQDEGDVIKGLKKMTKSRNKNEACPFVIPTIVSQQKDVVVVDNITNSQFSSTSRGSRGGESSRWSPTISRRQSHRIHMCRSIHSLIQTRKQHAWMGWAFVWLPWRRRQHIPPWEEFLRWNGITSLGRGDTIGCGIKYLAKVVKSSLVRMGLYWWTLFTQSTRGFWGRGFILLWALIRNALFMLTLDKCLSNLTCPFSETSLCIIAGPVD